MKKLIAIGIASGRVIVLDAATGATHISIRGDGSRIERLTFESASQVTIGRASGDVESVGIPEIA